MAAVIARPVRDMARRGRLRMAVNECGGGRQVISTVTGIPARTLAAWLSTGEPSLSGALAIAEACRVDLGWLATGSGPMRRGEGDAAPWQAPPPGERPPIGLGIHHEIREWLALKALWMELGGDAPVELDRGGWIDVCTLAGEFLCRAKAAQIVRSDADLQVVGDMVLDLIGLIQVLEEGWNRLRETYLADRQARLQAEADAEARPEDIEARIRKLGLHKPAEPLH